MERLRNESLALTKHQTVSSLATVEDGKPWGRVMAHAQVDDDFSIWYATFSFSNKVRQLKKNNEICVTMNEEGKDIRIFGKAEILEDAPTKHKMWQDSWSRYFKEGKDDPTYVLIKVNAERVEYRDFDRYGVMPVEVQF